MKAIILELRENIFKILRINIKEIKALKTITDIIKFSIKKRKKWLIPFAIMLVALAIVLVTAQGSVIAPFIYTLF